MSHSDIHTSAFYFFGCYRAGTADIQDLVTNASELAPVIETFLRTRENDHDNDAKTVQLV